MLLLLLLLCCCCHAAAAAAAMLLQQFVENIFPKVVSFYQKYAILLVEIVMKRQPLIINKKCQHLATSNIYYNVWWLRNNEPSSSDSSAYELKLKQRIISNEVLAFHLKNCKGTYNHIQRRG